MSIAIDHVIYHYGCPDGYTSAFLLNCASLTPPTMHEGKYGEAPPEGLSGTVVIADFSYSPEILAEIATNVDRLVLLDHHDTTLRQVGAAPEGLLSDVEIVLDMNRSGSGIVADWLNDVASIAPTSWRTRIVDYVEDRDLWRFSLPHCRAVMAVVNATPMHPPGPTMFDDWEATAIALDDIFERVVERGLAVCDREDVFMEQAMTTATWVVVGGYRIPVVSVPYGLGSDTANRLLNKYPDALFAGYYIDHDTHRQFGLRSRPDGVNVALIAETFSGGGHPPASGFNIPWGSGPLAPGTRFGDFGEGPDS